MFKKLLVELQRAYVKSEIYLLNGLVNPIFNPVLIIGMLAVPISVSGIFR